MFPDDSETRIDGRGARSGALGRGEQGEELEERGRNKMETMTRPASGEDKVREEDGRSFQSTQAVEGGPTCRHETLFIRHVRERGSSAKPIQRTTFPGGVAQIFLKKLKQL
jgi:hypothetical protein